MVSIILNAFRSTSFFHREDIEKTFRKYLPFVDPKHTPKDSDVYNPQKTHSLEEIPQNATNAFATTCNYLLFATTFNCFLQLFCTFNHSCNYPTTTFATNDFFILHIKFFFIHDHTHMSHYSKCNHT